MCVRFRQHMLGIVAGIGYGLACHATNIWHVESASFRRELKVEETQAETVTATTTVFLDERFTGFKLVDAHGTPHPYTLLDRAGSRCTFYFDAKPGQLFFLYPSTTDPLSPSDAPLCSGLCHRARQYDGTEVNTVAEFNALWEKSLPQGGRFESQVFSSSNPFGANENVLHQYDGVLVVTNSGLTQFCVASTDASFLLINNKLITAWPGKHPVTPGLDGSRRGSVQLAKGKHRFTFLHANSSAQSYAIAAMIPPHETRHTVLPPDAFTRVCYARVGPLVSRNGHRVADFIWEHTNGFVVGEQMVQAFLLEATPSATPSQAEYHWHFDDGTKATGRVTNHLFFAQGECLVTLTVTSDKSKENPTLCQQRIRVTPRYGQNEPNEAGALNLLDQAVRQEREAYIQPQGYALITEGYLFFLKEHQAAEFGERVLSAAEKIPVQTLGPLLMRLALAVQQVDEQYELAERCFRLLLKKEDDPHTLATAALHYGGMLNLCLNRPQEAREILVNIKRETLQEWEARLLDIYLADTALILDDLASAIKQYAAIPPPSDVVNQTGIDKKRVFAYHSRYFRIQNLLTQGLYRESLPEVDMLEWELPEERASPRTNLLKVQALIGNHQPRKAMVCLQRALRAEVDQTYTPKLRLELAKLQVTMNQFIPALQQIRQIRQESPWSLEEVEARTLLKVIERRKEEPLP